MKSAVKKKVRPIKTGGFVVPPLEASRVEFVSIIETLSFLYRNKVFLSLKLRVSKGETKMNDLESLWFNDFG